MLTSRLVKKEVVDLSDTMDVLAEVIHNQGDRLERMETMLMANKVDQDRLVRIESMLIVLMQKSAENAIN